MCIIEVNPVKKEIKEYLRFREKIIVLEYARKFDGPIATCREFNIPKSTFYEWKKKFDTEGIAGLRYKKKTSKPHPRKTPDKIINKNCSLFNCTKGMIRAITIFQCPIGIIGMENIEYFFLRKNTRS